MRLVRLLTARHVVNARVSRYAENDLHNLVLLGRQNEALAHARLRNDAAEKISGLLTMYRVLQEKGLPNSALLTEAQEVTPTLQDGRQRGSVLKDLAEALSKAGRFEEAKEVAHSIRYVVDSRRAAWTLRELAVALARAGHFEEARDVTATIEIDLQRAKVLSDVAGILTRAGSYDDATAIFDEAKVLARSIQSDEERVQALSNLTRTLAQAGRFDEGREVFRYTRNVRMSMEAWN
jgi:tetratricopeptide (TPR) repeat protein